MYLNSFLLIQALEQFETKPLWFFNFFESFYFIFTNITFTFFFLIGSILFFFFSYNKVFFISSYQVLVEKIYRFIIDLVINQTGKFGESYFPIIYVMFLFIGFSNIIGIIPGNFCLTSQLLVTFCLSFLVFFGLLIISILIQGFSFVFFFIPKNVPFFLLPFLTVIEIISYISRVFSLSLRLFANMVAGHALLHILSGSLVVGLKKIVSLNILYIFFFLFPILLLMSIICLEMGIAFLQAYVFVVLFCIYLNDCLGHH